MLPLSLRSLLLASLLPLAAGFSLGSSVSGTALSVGSSASGKDGRRAAVAAAQSRSGDGVTMNGGAEQQPIPVTMLCGFLGAGKTTVLRHLLHNKEGLKIGVLVNDVAAINVDAKLVQRGADGETAEDETPWGDDMVELSNGCACCSAGDDMFDSLARLVALSFSKGRGYDHIVFEASGVAEPKLLRELFQEAATAGWPLMKYIRLETMVTVVDSSLFLELYSSEDRIEDRPELGLVEDVDPDEPEWMRDTAWAGATAAQGPSGGVVQLLTEQVEIADVLVANKVDLVSEDQLEALKEILSAVNGFASVLSVTNGKVPLPELLTSDRGAGVATSNDVMDHKSSVDMANWLVGKAKTEAAAAAAEAAAEAAAAEAAAASHGHEHSHEAAAASHGHEHSHEEEGGVCSEPACTDPSHDHSHASASHGHEHSHEEGGACDDPFCTDPSHEHSHDNPSAQLTTAAIRFGINTFVYSRRRPFDSDRLHALLRSLPLSSTSSVGDADAAGGDAEGDGVSFKPVLRSKGFLWVAGKDEAACFWSQAGRYLEITQTGRWWASVPREQWPEEHVGSILEDFEGEGGDRRQELVFIGAGMSEQAIGEALDACLLTDEEMAAL